MIWLMMPGPAPVSLTTFSGTMEIKVGQLPDPGRHIRSLLNDDSKYSAAHAIIPFSLYTLLIHDYFSFMVHGYLFRIYCLAYN
jgi:hypothetical protein